MLLITISNLHSQIYAIQKMSITPTFVYLKKNSTVYSDQNDP